MYKKILLALDGSKASMRAADHALQLAKLAKAEIGAVDVLYTELTFEKSREEVLDEQRRIADKAFKEFTAKASKAGINVKVKFLEGSPGIKIADEAAEGKYGLIVMGSKGKGALGSVAEKVVRAATCPVLVVKG
ncbi:MAG: universal stress protein [Candidatus Hydrothermarchaeota archaeon]